MSKNNPGIHMPMPQAKMKPLTDEKKKIKIMQFLQQRRESFSLSILNGLCSNMGKDATNEHAMMMVDLAVDMADHLMEKLFPIKEEESK